MIAQLIIHIVCYANFSTAFSKILALLALKIPELVFELHTGLSARILPKETASPTAATVREPTSGIYRFKVATSLA
jgi:hypothetical protein